MDVQGYAVQGYTHLGQKTLQSIGDITFWHDYRVAPRIGRQFRMIDQSGNGMDLLHNTTSSAFVSASGWGVEATWGCSYLSDLSKVDYMWNGGAFAFYAVYRITDSSGLGQMFLTALGTAQSSSSSWLIGINQNEADLRMRAVLGGTQFQSAAGFIPKNEYVLLRYINYGAAAASPNFRMQCKTSVHTFHRTAWNTGAGSFMYQRQNNDNISHIKFQALYNMAGKTKSEIDAFDEEFCNTLKRDPEYSLLVT